jgi:hypothetical protein
MIPPMASSKILKLAALFGLSIVVACGDDDTNATGGSGGSGTGGGVEGGGGGGTGGAEAVCTEPTLVPCEDQVLLQMNLQDDEAPGAISSVADGAGFRSTIDATAGGAFAADPDSYVYAKFTATGLEKVALSDEASLTSMDWDIAFRRYVVRINSGHSGPTCVTAARVPGTPEYDDLSVDPSSLTFRADEYFTESCEVIADGTGLEGSPATALSSYWTYPGCVQMTGNVFVVQLADGQLVKLTVELYYNETAQQQCQDEGMVPMSGSDAANFQVRWAFL